MTPSSVRRTNDGKLPIENIINTQKALRCSCLSVDRLKEENLRLKIQKISHGLEKTTRIKTTKFGAINIFLSDTYMYAPTAVEGLLCVNRNGRWSQITVC